MSNSIRATIITTVEGEGSQVACEEKNEGK